MKPLGLPSAVFLFCSALLSYAHPACAGDDSIRDDLEVTESRNAASGCAVTLWMMQEDSLGTHCSKLPGAVGEESMKALKSWQERNMPYVDAALTYVALIGERLELRHGKGAKEAFHEDRGRDFVAATREAQVDWLPEGKATEHDCRKMATHTNAGDMDLATNAMHLQTLEAMRVAFREKG